MPPQYSVVYYTTLYNTILHFRRQLPAGGFEAVLLNDKSDPLGFGPTRKARGPRRTSPCLAAPLAVPAPAVAPAALPTVCSRARQTVDSLYGFGATPVFHHREAETPNERAQPEGPNPCDTPCEDAAAHCALHTRIAHAHCTRALHTRIAHDARKCCARAWHAACTQPAHASAGQIGASLSESFL